MPYSNENRFTLGRNRKRDKDKSPEFTGVLNIDGTEYFLNAWVNTNGKTGERFFSGTVKPKESRQPRDYAPPDDDDSSIPF